MSKNLVFQCHFSDRPAKRVDASKRCFETYARLHGADYILSNERYWHTDVPEPLSWYFEKLRVIYDESLDIYDNILYTDSDVLVQNYAENIFEKNYEGLAAWKPQNGYARITDLYKYHGIQTTWRGVNVFNSGVMLMSREFRQFARENFDPWQEWAGFPGMDPVMDLWHLADEPYLNCMVLKYDVPMTPISERWNKWYRDIPDKLNQDGRYNFIHFSNRDKQYMMNYYHAVVERILDNIDYVLKVKNADSDVE